MKSTGGQNQISIQETVQKHFSNGKEINQSRLPDNENGLKDIDLKNKIMRERREVLTWETRRGKKMKLEHL